MRNNRGSTIAAALTFVFIVFLLTTVMLGRVASTFYRVQSGHNSASAMFLAEAGVQKAGQMLVSNRGYTGETATRLETGTFDVKAVPDGGSYLVTSTGRANGPFARKPVNTVRARVTVQGSTFRVTDWSASR